MGRKILFRGKRVDDDEWIYGCYCKIPEEFITEGINIRLKGCEFHSAIQGVLENENGCIEYITQPIMINENTLGQYTGLEDKNGTKIFEGDILKFTRTKIYAPSASFNGQDLISTHLIYWNEEKCSFYQDHYTEERCIGSGSIIFDDERAKENIVEVIGNIYDNKELLERE